MLLDPLDLTYKIGPKGYIITRKRSADSISAAAALAHFQARCAARIERKLKTSRFSYEFDKPPLAKVAAFFEQQSGENVVLDPRGGWMGRSIRPTPDHRLGQGRPPGRGHREAGDDRSGCGVVVRDEVIVLEAEVELPRGRGRREMIQSAGAVTFGPGQPGMLPP